MTSHSDPSIQQFVNDAARLNAGFTCHPNGLQRCADSDFRLALVAGDASPEVVDLVGQTHVDIGRHVENGLIVRDTTCSRHHCRMICTNGAWFIEDLFSRNGTYVNGSKIHGEYLLCNGDEILIGKTRLQFTEIPATDV